MGQLRIGGNNAGGCVAGMGIDIGGSNEGGCKAEMCSCVVLDGNKN